MTNASVVIDSGFAFKALVTNPAQDALRELLGTWRRKGFRLLAPSLWLYEVTSAISKGVYFGAITESEGRQALALATGLDVQLVPPDAHLALAAYDWTRRLQRAAAYDSFYLALAEALSCELWTTDRRLQAAAGMSWVRTPRV